VLKLAFLWHQHQPYYKDLRTGEYLLPWVRLHAIKDYLDMVEILKPYSRLRQTFNMVPSLLEQIEDYATKKVSDPWLDLSLKTASHLNDSDKSRMIDLFFQANYDNMIEPLPRYRQLYDNRGKSENWNDRDWRDLQCLFNLAWTDPSFKNSGIMKNLSDKGESYTEENKHEILSFQRRIIASVIPRMKEMMEGGQIEISTTPYFHPIMPLLYDTDIARTALPDIKLPSGRFQHPEDVDRQVAMAVELYSRMFGTQPRGMWPSEGAISEEIVPVLLKYGFQWMATDEEILARSLPPIARSDKKIDPGASGHLYKSYRLGGEGEAISILFRDHTLSDNIGFVYSKWDPDKAAVDFMNRLKAIHNNALTRKIKNPIVSVILDGENAWEYYTNDGHDFLEALYSKISDADWLETTTFADHINRDKDQVELKRIFPGSWIDHNFAIWIGHPEDNKAWDLLSRARDELESFEKDNPDFDSTRLTSAWREIFIAEGSDWFWWFGDDHVGPNNDDFDRLFRSHLANVYYLTDREPPSEFFVPVRSAYQLGFLESPLDYIAPKMDGLVTHYYEWHHAGLYDCLKAGSAMHKSRNIVSQIWFGYDPKNLYFRLDPSKDAGPDSLSTATIEIEFMSPEKYSLILQPGKDVEAGEGALFAFKDILEISLSISVFKSIPDRSVAFRILVRVDDELIEAWPASEAFRIDLPRPGMVPWII
jgi:alpha-amylase/alpha-mannosidase (GH57 family)